MIDNPIYSLNVVVVCVVDSFTRRVPFAMTVCYVNYDWSLCEKSTQTHAHAHVSIITTNVWFNPIHTLFLTCITSHGWCLTLETTEGNTHSQQPKQVGGATTCRRAHLKKIIHRLIMPTHKASLNWIHSWVQTEHVYDTPCPFTLMRHTHTHTYRIFTCEFTACLPRVTAKTTVLIGKFQPILLVPAIFMLFAIFMTF